MAKIKISELASQLNKENKDVINTLEAMGVENNGKKFAANSSVEEDVAKRVKERMGEPKKTEEPPKKKIFMVSNPQNSSQGYRGGRNQGGQRPAQNSSGGAQRGNSQNRQTGQQGYQGQNRQGNQANQQSSGYQGQNRPSGQGYQGQNRSSGQGYQGQNRPAGQQGYQGQNRQGNQMNQQSQNRPNQTNSGQNRQEGQNQQARSYQNQNRNNTASQESARNNQNRPGQNNSYSGGQNRNRQPGSGQQGQNRTGQTPGRTNNYPGQNNRPGNSRPQGDNRKQELKIPEVRTQEAAPEKRTDRRTDKFQDKKQQDNRNVRGVKTGTRNNIPKKAAVEPPKPQPVKEPEIKVITLPETLTIKELADKMKIQPSVIVKKMFLQGKVVTINQEITFDIAEEIAMEFDVIAEPEVKIDVIEELLREEEEDESAMVSRPPVICVMGHVDHGKTSLLDAIRSTNVIAKEAGGITQHIGAYVVEINGEKITFLDTPGHEAFTAMRMRGAQSTDIAILVVAADDGVMPQTIEAINHAKAAGIEIIVAINKIDKPSANIDRVKQELIEYELVAEDWGGSTVFVPVSAHTNEGIENLLEMILLTAEVKELKANPKRKARGLVIEAQLDKGKGPVATVLVQKGTLHIGDVIAAGSSHGKVRAMIDDKGRRLKEAGPSTPVEILGLNDVPNAGEIFVACENEKEARSFAETFISQGKEKLLEDTKAKLSLDDLFTKIQAGSLKELNIIVKADVQGSVEAIKQSLLKLSNDEVVVKVIHGGVGAINESDVILASASSAIIIGFNVKPDNTAKSIAERESVDVRLYRVIYNAIEDVEAAMKGMLDPTFEEKIIGHAEVRQIFKASGLGTIAGSYILDGKFQRGCTVRIRRDGELIFEGALASLKRFKDDVKEVNTGYECGLVFEKFNDIKEGDQVEAYIMEEVPR